MWLLLKFMLIALPALAHGEPTFTIAVSRDSYALGEPVPVTFRLENTTDDSFELRYPLDYEWGLEVLITRPDGETFLYTSPAHAFAATSRRSNPGASTLEPGEVVTAERFVSYQVPLSDFALREVGAYKLQARFPYEQGALSNTVTVMVLEPDGNDRGVLAYIKDKKLEALLTDDARRWSANDEQIAALQELASSGKCVVGSCTEGMFDLGINRYAPYAALALRSLGYEASALELTPTPPLKVRGGGRGYEEGVIPPSPSEGRGQGEGVSERENGSVIIATLSIVIILIGIAVTIIWFRFRMTKE